MSVSISDVSTAVDDITQNVTSQAEYTRAATEDVEALAMAFVQTEKEVEHLDSNAQDMQTLNDTSTKTLDELVGISEVTRTQILDMYDQAAKTNESAQKIKDAANLINDIADQTDLLALMLRLKRQEPVKQEGVAVVAEQIANLAKQSAENVVEIDHVVEELLVNSNQFIHVMEGMQTDVHQQFEYIHAAQNDFNALSSSLKGLCQLGRRN